MVLQRTFKLQSYAADFVNIFALILLHYGLEKSCQLIKFLKCTTLLFAGNDTVPISLWHADIMWSTKYCLVFSARCNIYISHLYYDVSVRLSVRLSVTFVHSGHRVQWIPDIFACLHRWMPLLLTDNASPGSP